MNGHFNILLNFEMLNFEMIRYGLYETYLNMNGDLSQLIIQVNNDS